MDLTELTLEEFLSEDEAASAPAAVVNSWADYSTIFSPLVRAKIRDLDADYALHRLDDFDLGDVALLCKGELVGFYHHNLLMISEAHHRKGLSVPLILEAAKPRPNPNRRKLTIAGRAALTSAWRVANGLQTSPWP